MVRADSDRDLARVAVMAWYYGIYCAEALNTPTIRRLTLPCRHQLSAIARAMIAAMDCSQQQDHTGTAIQWDRQIAAAGLLPKPFNYRLTTLVKKDAEPQIESLRGGNSYVLPNVPTTPDDAHGACVSYLSGTRNYRQWQIEEDLKLRELPKLGLADFRSKQAKQLRDSRLHGTSLGFLHQAFRYSGKANYRDALFLTYEAQVGTVLSGFIPDMEAVLRP